MNNLSNKVAVITGSTRGFGLAVARAFAQEGAAVVIASRSEQAVQQTVESLRLEGFQAAGLPTDVGDLEQVQALARHAQDIFGGLDIWVNNAGIASAYGPTVQIPIADFSNVLRTNIFGVYFGSIVAMRSFLSQGRGKLINILGRGSHEPVPMQNAYASSKAWIRNFTLALARENGNSGVGVFAFNPGLMDTDLMEDIRSIAGYADRLKPLNTVMRLWAKAPAEPARKAVWLASSATDGRTGLELKELDFKTLVGGVIREGLRRVTGRPAPGRRIQITSVPAEFQAGPEEDPS